MKSWMRNQGGIPLTRDLIVLNVAISSEDFFNFGAIIPTTISIAVTGRSLLCRELPDTESATSFVLSVCLGTAKEYSGGQ